MSTVRQDLLSDGSEFQVCGAATDKDRRANSVAVMLSLERRAGWRTFQAFFVRVTMTFIYELEP